MHNLHSFVELQPKPKKAKLSPTASEALEKTRELLSGLRSTSKFIGRYDDGRMLVSKLCESVTKDLRALRRKTFEADLSLPDEMIDCPQVDFYGFDRIELRPTTDFTRNLSLSPKSTTDSMRSLADALGMVIIPAAALNRKSINTADYTTRSTIDSFLRATKEAAMDAYVVCPVSLYDVLAHASDNTDSSVASYSKRYESVMMAISMQIPMFRTIMANVQALDNRVSQLEVMVKNVRTQVATLQAQVDRLQDQVDREAQQRAIQEAVNAELRAQIQAMELASFRAIDPMLFAVRKGADLMGSEPAIVGPAWGPDLPDILVALSGLTPIKSQRNQLSQALYQLF